MPPSRHFLSWRQNWSLKKTNWSIFFNFIISAWRQCIGDETILTIWGEKVESEKVEIEKVEMSKLKRSKSQKAILKKAKSE